MFSSVVVSLLIQATLTHGTWISVSNGGSWGDWGPSQRCPQGTSAIGFSLKVEKPLGGWEDDTALNGIKLFCGANSNQVGMGTITSKVGDWGDWTATSYCPRGNLISFALKVEGSQGGGDDTAANNIKMKCSGEAVLEGSGGPWGEYGGWSGPCYSGICAIRTRVENSQGAGDDTALNDVQFECC